MSNVLVNADLDRRVVVAAQTCPGSSRSPHARPFAFDDIRHPALLAGPTTESDSGEPRHVPHAIQAAEAREVSAMSK